MKLAVSMTVIVAVLGLCLFTTTTAYDDEMVAFGGDDFALVPMKKTSGYEPIIRFGKRYWQRRQGAADGQYDEKRMQMRVGKREMRHIMRLGKRGAGESEWDNSDYTARPSVQPDQQPQSR